MAAEKAVKVLASLKAPLPKGKNYRLLCLTGRDKGKIYLLNNDRVVLGRSSDVDITIYDIKSSKNHAELKKVAGQYVLTDLGSRNGIFVNELRIAQHTLQNGDKFVIGQTVYKYEVIEVEESSLKAVDKDNKSKLDADQTEAESNPAEAGSKKKKRMIYILVIGAVLYMFLDEDAPKQDKPRATENYEDSLIKDLRKKASDKDLSMDPEVKTKLEAVIHRGQREFREKNYFRAMSEFKHALNLDPENSVASYYLAKTKQALDDEVISNFDSAKKAIESIKYNNAVINYCTVIRLLKDYPEDERYIAAKKNLAIVEKKLELEIGEIKCL
jgi:pSer/pThr/pTyr-binding forkhead associated (FHA) protein